MTARHRIPELSPEGRAAAQALRGAVAGEVVTTPLRRWLYSTDASGYRVVPEVVVVAASPDDLAAVAAVSAQTGLPVVARGAASSLAGQAIGPGIVVDCFRLDRILEIDAGRPPRPRPARRGAGGAQRGRGAARPRVRSGHVHRRPGDDRRHGRQQLVRLPLDRLRREQGQGAARLGVLAGGEAATFGACAGGDLAAGAGGPAGERLAAALAQVREQYREPIASGFPQTRRCTSGYNLRELLAPEPNLGRLLAGSEGTLALFTELEVLLDPRPARAGGRGVHVRHPARGARGQRRDPRDRAVGGRVPRPRAAAPRAQPRDASGAWRRCSPATTRPCSPSSTRAATEEALAGLARLRALAGELGATQEAWLEQPADLAEAAALRRAALPLLMGAPGAERPASFVEDTAVAPERLADFVADFQQLVAAHGARASFTGHASAGCLHIRPLLDLKTAAGVARMEALAADVGRAGRRLPRRHLRRARRAGARAAGSCRSSSAPASTRRWSPSRTPSTRAGCSTPASSWTARR